MEQTKEQVYDETIDPLIRAIHSICIDNDIPMLASFDITEDKSGEMADIVMSHNLAEKTAPTDAFILAYGILSDIPFEELLPTEQS